MQAKRASESTFKRYVKRIVIKNMLHITCKLYEDVAQQLTFCCHVISSTDEIFKYYWVLLILSSFRVLTERGFLSRCSLSLSRILSYVIIVVPTTALAAMEAHAEMMKKIQFAELNHSDYVCP